MRNMIKTQEVGGNTYNLFLDTEVDESQYGFSINRTEVKEVTTDAKLAMSIFDKLTDGEVAEVHLKDICEDAVTEAAMI